MTAIPRSLNALPVATRDEVLPVSLAVSFLIPACNSAGCLERTVEEVSGYLVQRYRGSHEILIVPNGETRGSPEACEELALELAERFELVHVCRHEGPPGKGAALRTGLLRSRGRWIFLTDADLPYDLSFFDRAASELRAGADLVSGNRRLADSRFHVPNRLLPLVYSRHRKGLLFNRLVRTLLPIETRDTQAGIKALSRDLALSAFGRMICPGFLYDLELFLTAAGEGRKHVELPVDFYLRDEKSTVKMYKDAVLACVWMARIARRSRRGAYSASP